MNTVTKIGDVPWTRNDILGALDEFEMLYEKRPIRMNEGGMRAPHMFAVWFMMRALAPKTVIESGVWKGQSTWLLENACPNANIISIDPNLSAREYISGTAQYSNLDFSEHDWTSIIPEETVVFFDDHQNAYTRIQQCWWFGFRHVVFEDNYPPSRGDCYSLKKVFSCTGFQPDVADPNKRRATLSSRIRRRMAKLSGITKPQAVAQQSTQVRVLPNQHDAMCLVNRLRTYYEFPPVFQPPVTRWGDPWDQYIYPTPLPLLQLTDAAAHPLLFDEALFYTWICYALLKTPSGD